jgi:hypothetical protein
VRLNEADYSFCRCRRHNSGLVVDNLIMPARATYGPPVTTSMDHLAALAHRTLSHQNIGVPPSIVREQRRVTYGD